VVEEEPSSQTALTCAGGGAESPKRGNSPVRNNRGPAPKNVPNPTPLNSPDSGRSLAEIQQDRQRDSVMEAMRRGGAVEISYNNGSRHSHGGADDRGAMVVKGRENQYETAARK
jgi:hypothetical protein